MSYNKALAITPSDTVGFNAQINGGIADAIYVGGAGIVQAVLEDDTVVAFTCIAGQVLPVQAQRVNDTDTTATLLVALYRV